MSVEEISDLSDLLRFFLWCILKCDDSLTGDTNSCGTLLNHCLLKQTNLQVIKLLQTNKLTMNMGLWGTLRLV